MLRENWIVEKGVRTSIQEFILEIVELSILPCNYGQYRSQRLVHGDAALFNFPEFFAGFPASQDTFSSQG